MYVVASELGKSFSFENTVETTSHVRFTDAYVNISKLIHAIFLRGMWTKNFQLQSDFQDIGSIR